MSSKKDYPYPIDFSIFFTKIESSMITKAKIQKFFKQVEAQLKSSASSDELKSIKAELEKLVDFDVKESQENEKMANFELPKEVHGQSDFFCVFSDGACRGNPGPGAWGYMIQDESGKVLVEDSEVENPTTNNRMELIGAIEGIKSAINFDSSSTVYIYSDSRYLVDGISKWVEGWKKRGWKKSDNKVPENVDLWQSLDELNSDYKLRFFWVKGHAGHPQNENCDLLANKALDQAGY